ncbi:MAG: NAD(P)-binding protein [Myxococcales bacterium]|nr:NAD(P)-binding protein [Myxococcales bacterium]
MATIAARPKIAAGPSRQVYDAVVVGGQLGGALAAALLAKRGHRVLLVEHDGLGHGYEHGGYLLPYAPLVAPPLKAMPAFDEALVELGLNTAVQRALRPHAPDLQLVLPSHRLDLHHDEAPRLAELTREFGEGAGRIAAALKAAASQHEQSDPFFREHPNLPPDGFFESLALKRQIGRHPALAEPSAALQADLSLPVLGGLLQFLTYANEPKQPLAQTRPLSQALASPNRYPGGKEGLRELFTRRLVELGGDLLWRESEESSVVEELFLEGGRVAGLKLVQSDHEYRCSSLIGATDAGALRRLVPDKRKHRALAELLDQVEPRKFLFAINWVLPAEVLPKGMGELVLLDTADDLSPLLVQVSHARKIGAKADEPKERVVCAGAFVPTSYRDLGEDHLRSLAARMGVHLDELMPFARRRAILESAPYLDAGGVRGSRLLPHPLYEVNAEHFLGITGLPQRTPVKNLFLASREVLPGLGLEGEVMAGVRAARLVQESLGKKDPLKR